MKSLKLYSVLSVFFLFAGCSGFDFHGHLNIKKNLVLTSYNKDSSLEQTSVTLTPGTENAIFLIESKEAITLSLDNMPEHTFRFEIPEGQTFPVDGNFSLGLTGSNTHSLSGVIATDIQRSETMWHQEACSADSGGYYDYHHNRHYDYLDYPYYGYTPYAPYRYRRGPYRGSRTVEYYIETIRKNATVHFNKEDDSEPVATFEGTFYDEAVIETYVSPCYYP